jgi:hypothetical protein
VRITITTDDHWWWDRLAVELSKGRKAAIMPITINPHPVEETSDIPSIPELQAKLELTIDCYRALTHSRHRGEVAHSIVVASRRLDDARWQLAMESNRWVQRDAVTMWGGERGYWAARQAMQRLKWACRNLSPSTGKELELHPTVFPVYPVDHQVGRGAQR